MKKTIQFEISNCKECPFFDKARAYTSDSFEVSYDWFCKRSDDKKIASHVGWSNSEESRVKIPNWCPCVAK